MDNYANASLKIAIHELQCVQARLSQRLRAIDDRMVNRQSNSLVQTERALAQYGAYSNARDEVLMQIDKLIALQDKQDNELIRLKLKHDHLANTLRYTTND